MRPPSGPKATEGQRFVSSSLLASSFRSLFSSAIAPLPAASILWKGNPKGVRDFGEVVMRLNLDVSGGFLSAGWCDSRGQRMLTVQSLRTDRIKRSGQDAGGLTSADNT